MGNLLEKIVDELNPRNDMKRIKRSSIHNTSNLLKDFANDLVDMGKTLGSISMGYPKHILRGAIIGSLTIGPAIAYAAYMQGEPSALKGGLIVGAYGGAVLDMVQYTFRSGLYSKDYDIKQKSGNNNSSMV